MFTVCTLGKSEVSISELRKSTTKKGGISFRDRKLQRLRRRKVTIKVPKT